MTKMIGIAEFKAKFERLIQEVQAGGPAITVTKRGKPVALISAVPEEKPKAPLASAFGMLRSDKYRFDDPFEPVSDMDEWDANNPADMYRRP